MQDLLVQLHATQKANDQLLARNEELEKEVKRLEQSALDLTDLLTPLDTEAEQLKQSLLEARVRCKSQNDCETHYARTTTCNPQCARARMCQQERLKAAKAEYKRQDDFATIRASLQADGRKAKDCKNVVLRFPSDGSTARLDGDGDAAASVTAEAALEPVTEECRRTMLTMNQTATQARQHLSADSLGTLEQRRRYQQLHDDVHNAQQDVQRLYLRLHTTNMRKQCFVELLAAVLRHTSARRSSGTTAFVKHTDDGLDDGVQQQLDTVLDGEAAVFAVCNSAVTPSSPLAAIIESAFRTATPPSTRQRLHIRPGCSSIGATSDSATASRP